MDGSLRLRTAGGLLCVLVCRAFLFRPCSLSRHIHYIPSAFVNSRLSLRLPRRGRSTLRWLPWSTDEPAKPSGVVLVDGYGGTKAMLQEKAAARGLLVAELWSPPHPKPAPKGPALKDWLKKLPFSVSGVLAFSDPHALPIVEEVLSLVGLTGSGDVAADALLEQARRNKHLMQVVLKDAGLTSCKWVLACSESEVRTFVEAELSQKAVMKPFLGGSAGNNVTLLDYGNRPVESEALVRQVFRSRPAGAEFMSVLVQEHLAGDEYAVDIVVRDGAMAVMGVFKYDVRALNGAEFVVFGVLIEPIQKGSPEEAVATYAMESLAALGMRNGPAHVEVKMTAENGPVLIEANCNRFTGLDMIFDVAERAVGYTAIDAFLDAADDRVSAEEWRSRYPALPSPNLRAYGGVAQMHARESGIYEGGDEEAAAEIMELDSVFKLESRDIAVGYPLVRTVSDATCPAEVGLLCNSRSQLMADYDRIFQIERRMFRVQRNRLEGAWFCAGALADDTLYLAL